MTIRVAINGMGRIGRCYLRYCLDHTDLDVVAVNDISDAAAIASLLRYDSTFGPLRRQVEVEDGALVIDGRKMAISACRDPAELPWSEHDVEVVVEATGRFKNRSAAAAHLDAGASKVLISAPGKEVDATI